MRAPCSADYRAAVNRAMGLAVERELVVGVASGGAAAGLTRAWSESGGPSRNWVAERW